MLRLHNAHLGFAAVMGCVTSSGLCLSLATVAGAAPSAGLKVERSSIAMADSVGNSSSRIDWLWKKSSTSCGAFGFSPWDDPNDDQGQSQGVVRLARFLSVRGNVTWRADEGLDWSEAVTNLPLRQGAQIWVSEGGRAEVQFDDGSVLRLGNGAVVTLKTLFSDEDGEFTELEVTSGLVTLRARHDRGVYRLNTPVVALTTRGPSKVRLGVADGIEVAVRQGEVAVQGNRGDTKLRSGDYLDLADANSPFDPMGLPGADSWDRWNETRDREMDGVAERPSQQHLPPNIAITATNLDDYGTWRRDPEYGYIWCPRVEVVDWRPYHYGHWTWVNPFGWTWVSDEPWGWAPYHYGTWVSRPYGWAWVPGPVTQHWSPAVVHFCESGDSVAWVPLAPAEVRYAPVLAVGFRSGNWSTFFSIGAAAVYYPGPANYCVPRRFNTTYVNHVTYVNNVTIVNNNTTINNVSRNRFYNSAEFFAANRNTYVNNSKFVPINSKVVAGASVVSRTSFGSRTAYRAVTKTTSTELFTSGRAVAAPVQGARPVAGPVSVAPSREALTPTRNFVTTNAPISLTRRVYEAPLPQNVARRAVQVAPSGAPIPQRNPDRTIGGGASFGTPGDRTSGTSRPGFGSNRGSTTSPSGDNGARVGRPGFGSDRGAATSPSGDNGSRISRPGFGSDRGSATPPSGDNGSRTVRPGQSGSGGSSTGSEGVVGNGRSGNTGDRHSATPGVGNQSDRTGSSSDRTSGSFRPSTGRSSNSNAADSAAEARRALGIGSSRRTENSGETGRGNFGNGSGRSDGSTRSDNGTGSSSSGRFGQQGSTNRNSDPVTSPRQSQGSTGSRTTEDGRTFRRPGETTGTGRQSEPPANTGRQAPANGGSNTTPPAGAGSGRSTPSGDPRPSNPGRPIPPSAPTPGYHNSERGSSGGGQSNPTPPTRSGAGDGGGRASGGGSKDSGGGGSKESGGRSSGGKDPGKR